MLKNRSFTIVLKSLFHKNDSFFKIFWKIHSFCKKLSIFQVRSNYFKSPVSCFFSFVFKKLTFCIFQNNPIRLSIFRRFFPEWHPFPRKISVVLKNFFLSKKRCASLQSIRSRGRVGIRLWRTRLAMKWPILGRFSNSLYRNIKWNKKYR